MNAATVVGGRSRRLEGELQRLGRIIRLQRTTLRLTRIKPRGPKRLLETTYHAKITRLRALQDHFPWCRPAHTHPEARMRIATLTPKDHPRLHTLSPSSLTALSSSTLYLPLQIFYQPPDSLRNRRMKRLSPSIYHFYLTGKPLTNF